MISEERLEKALIYRAKTDEEHAKLKTKVEYLDWKKKKLKGDFITNKCSDNLSLGVRSEKWYASEDYGKFIEEHSEVYEKFNVMDNKRKTEGIIIDLFRTLEASRRKNNI